MQRGIYSRLGVAFKPKPLDGRAPVVIVTGATEGIGYELALRFAREGLDVMLVARSPGNVEEARQRIAEASGRRTFGVPADLATEAGIDAVDAALNAHGLYGFILVNNAGVGYGGEFEAQGGAALRRMIDLNITALSELTRRRLPDMIRAGGGGVLNVGSLAGFFPGPYQAAYYASKAYVRSLSNALAEEMRGKDVRVSVAAPGPVSTKFHQKAGVRNANYLKFPGAISAHRTARGAYLGFWLRLTVIVPGTLPFIASIFSRAIPTPVITPFIGWLLKKRY
ncbi:MAG: SDR family NAD(P)-dependent oxidoreductase [Hyphomicrobiales bacterium]|nr:SDR family NAD(P)-dependent oxidoreductase [Hyphomicrobiales bacterium]